MEQSDIFDTIIIGGGAAGFSAGIYSARKGLNTLVIAKSPGGNVMLAPEVENFLGFPPTSGVDLAQKFRGSFERYIGNGIQFEEGVEVINIIGSFPEFKVETGNGKNYQGKTIIIASGRAPRLLGIPGEKEFIGKGVAVCAVCDAPLFRNKQVAVVGGGNSALGTIFSLSKLAKKVIVINLTDDLTGDKVMADKIKKASNVEILNNHGVLEILGEKVVTGIKVKEIQNNTNSGKESILPVDGVFIEVGYEPSIKFDNLTEKNGKGEIIVNESGATSVQGIWAAGDVNNLWGEQMIISAGEGAKSAIDVANFLASQDE